MKCRVEDYEYEGTPLELAQFLFILQQMNSVNNDAYPRPKSQESH